MTLSKRLAGNFTSGLQHRGNKYFWGMHVHIEHGSEFEVRARVRGSQTYEVNLDLQDSVLSAWCDCPYFESNGPCKHLWATILAAERDGHLSSAASSQNLTLDCGDFGIEDEFDYEDQESLSTYRSRRISPAAPKASPWRKQIDDISNLRLNTNRPDSAWPAKREVLYIVDV